jgi:hypothetical protein
MLGYRVISLLAEDPLEGDRLVKREVDIPSNYLQWLEGVFG